MKNRPNKKLNPKLPVIMVHCTPNNYYAYFTYSAIHSTAGFLVICVISDVAYALMFTMPRPV